MFADEIKPQNDNHGIEAIKESKSRTKNRLPLRSQELIRIDKAD